MKSFVDNFDLAEIVKSKIPVDGNASKLMSKN